MQPRTLSACREATIIDALNEGFHQIRKLPDGHLRVGLGSEEIVERIPRNTELVGVSCPFSHLADVCSDVIHTIKTKRPLLPIVLGGVYPSTQPRAALQSGCDFIIAGEGEIPLVELARWLRSDRQGDLPLGVITASSQLGSCVVTNRITNLDEIPIPDRKAINFQNCVHRSPRRFDLGKTASIVTSRGCPFDCRFCSVHPVCGYKWRSHSPERVLAEVDYLTEEFGVQILEIEDDNFSLHKSRCLKILNGLAERVEKGRLKGWLAPNGLRIDTLDEDVIKVFPRSQCLGFALALEHGHEAVLHAMDKRLSLEKALEVVYLVSKYKITNCAVFLICGYPGETEDAFNGALSYYKALKDINPQLTFICNIVQPYPGTKLLEDCLKNGYARTVCSTTRAIEHLSTVLGTIA